jgi:TetR/AcrR family transcriptional regulator
VADGGNRRGGTLCEEEILRRGLDLFAEMGYEQTTVRELARRLGVSHNFINDRYGSKMQFWRAVVDFATADAGRPIQQADEELDDVSRIATTIRRFYRSTARHPQLQRLIFDESARESERIAYLYHRYINRTLEVLAPSLHRLIAAGRMPDVPMHLLYSVVIGPVSGLINRPLATRLGLSNNPTPEELGAFADGVADLVVSAVFGARPLNGKAS